MDSQLSLPISKTNKKSGQNMIGYLIAAAGLGWVFYDIQFEKILENLGTIQWWWVGLAILFDILSYLCQGLRWQYLLRPVGKLTMWRTTQAIYAGLFTNEIIPLRFGELIRAYLLSRWISVNFVKILPSMIVERFIDGIWLALSIGLAALFITLPSNLLAAGDILGGIVILSTGLFIFIVFRKQNESSRFTDNNLTGWKPIRRVRAFFTRMEKGLYEIGISTDFYIAALVSIFILVFQAIAFWLIMRAYGLPQSVWVGAVIFLIVHIGTALPNAPANIGSYQFFCVIGLTIFGVEKTTAAVFSLVVFILLTIPLWVIGFFALSQAGITIHSLRAEIKKIVTVD